MCVFLATGRIYVERATSRDFFCFDYDPICLRGGYVMARILFFVFLWGFAPDVFVYKIFVV